MTSITLTDAQLDHLADVLAGRLAARLADRLAPACSAPETIDPAELARILGVARSTVYAHADELGAIRVGSRVRFDPQRALTAWTARSGGERSDGASVNGDGPSAPPAARAPRRAAAGLPKPGSLLKVKPAPRGRRRSGEQR